MEYVIRKLIINNLNKPFSKIIQISGSADDIGTISQTLTPVQEALTEWEENTKEVGHLSLILSRKVRRRRKRFNIKR